MPASSWRDCAKRQGWLTHTHAYDAMVDATLDALGAHMEEYVDLNLLLEIASSRNAGTQRREAI